MRMSRELLLIYVAASVRAFGIGLLGVVVGVYLSRVGLNATRIGLVLAAGLAGVTLATAILGYRGDRIGRRRTLVYLAVFGCAGGVGLALVPGFGPLLALAFIGMLNGMGTDRSATFALELAIIPGLVPNDRRTWAIAVYNVLLDGAGALGALAGALPLALQSWAALDLTLAYKYVFFGYAALQLVTAALYSLLSQNVEVPSTNASPAQGVAPAPPPAGPVGIAARSDISPETRSIVRRLAALFSLDAFGGGFLGDALVAYWFFLRFGIDEKQLGVLFFAVHLLNAASHLGAAWLARRIGLVNTMVFTHFPSSFFLIGAAFAPSPKFAIVLFLLRESLVEMDVPTRQSYVAAVVRPQERTYASSITNVTRTVAWAAASSVAGVAMQNVAFSAPLVVGGSCKILYDLLLYRGFRHLKAPEEQVRVASRQSLVASKDKPATDSHG